MQLSFITPVKLLDSFGPESDFLFVEADIFLKSHELRKYIYRWEKEIVLDNSAFLLGESMILSKYLNVLDIVKPTRAIVPDALRDWKRTVDLARVGVKPMKETSPNTKLIGVPHGKNISEWLVSADFLFSDLKCDILGLTAALPNISGLKSENYPKGNFRSMWLEMVYKLWGDTYSEIFKMPIHVLGLQHPHELYHFALLKKRLPQLQLQWNDSGIAFQAAAQKVFLKDVPQFAKTLTPFFEKTSFWKDKRDFIWDNVNFLREMDNPASTIF